MTVVEQYLKNKYIKPEIPQWTPCTIRSNGLWNRVLHQCMEAHLRYFLILLTSHYTIIILHNQSCKTSYFLLFFIPHFWSWHSNWSVKEQSHTSAAFVFNQHSDFSPMTLFTELREKMYLRSIKSGLPLFKYDNIFKGERGLPWN